MTVVSPVAKAIVLCAGLGTRLRPITDETPKPMIEVGGEPLLFRQLRMLRDGGAEQVAINLHHLGGVIRDAVGSGDRFGLQVVYHEEPELLGSAGALNGFPGFFDAPFFVVYGDVYYGALDLRAVAFFHLAQRASMTIVTHKVADASQKGVVESDERTGRVSSFVEKPKNPPQNAHVNAGVYCCEPRIAAMIPPGASDFGSDLIPSLIASGEAVYAYPASSLVVDIGTPDGLEEARKAANRN
jgi:NDP-sugar pyrophosphorylase family protein